MRSPVALWLFERFGMSLAAASVFTLLLERDRLENLFEIDKRAA